MRSPRLGVGSESDRRELVPFHLFGAIPRNEKVHHFDHPRRSMLGFLVPAFRRASLAGLKAAATLLLFALPASAVCHVVTPAGAGLRDGSTWDNAFAGLPATLVRGDVYYIATGNYTGGYRFNTPESGTTVITIKKATPTDHCTETGWVASFGVGQAVWDISNGGTFQFTDNGYWVFDGQYRSGLKSGHGFKINWGTKGVGTSNTLYAVNVVGCASGPPCTPQLRNITVRYLEIAGGGVNGTTDDSFAISSVSRNAAGTQATVVTSSNARYIADNQPTVVGSLIAVSGVADASFNTTSARVIATSDQTHFTYANVGTANATSSGGTVTGGLGGLFEFDFRYTGTLDGLTLEYSYVHDSSDTPLQNDGRPSNTTIQYNVFARNTSSGNHHSEGFADQHSNHAGSIDPNGRTNVRYNISRTLRVQASSYLWAPGRRIAWKSTATSSCGIRATLTGGRESAMGSSPRPPTAWPTTGWSTTIPSSTPAIRRGARAARYSLLLTELGEPGSPPTTISATFRQARTAVIRCRRLRWSTIGRCASLSECVPAK